jgi:hypothetical protein
MCVCQAASYRLLRQPPPDTAVEELLRTLREDIAVGLSDIFADLRTRCNPLPIESHYEPGRVALWTLLAVRPAENLFASVWINNIWINDRHFRSGPNFRYYYYSVRRQSFSLLFSFRSAKIYSFSLS